MPSLPMVEHFQLYYQALSMTPDYLFPLSDGADTRTQARWNLVQDCDRFESPRARFVTPVSGCCTMLVAEALVTLERVRKSLQGPSKDSRKRKVNRWIPLN
jgi:hypothetical protein